MQDNKLAVDFNQIPWLQRGYSELISRFKGPMAPHAIMLYGKEGLGKTNLVDMLVAGILCLKPINGQSCGTCQSCRWLATKFHPDFYEITGENEIKVDAVRKIHHVAQLTPETGRKVIAIKHADRMNLNAANSLLKVLEEPPSDLFFILESSRVEKLPITVRSRCQNYFVASPSEADALSYLQSLIAGHYTVSEHDLKLLLGLSFDAPFVALTYLENGYLEKRVPLLQVIQKLFTGDIVPAKGVATLLESEDLSFDLLFFLLTSAFNREKVSALPNLHTIFSALQVFPEKFRLLQYEKLVEIDRLRETQTRTDWALEAWFVDFLG